MKKLVLLIALALFFMQGCAKDESDNPITPNPGNDPPASPSNPTPGNNSTGQNRFVSLRWQCSDPDAGDTLKYDIFFDDQDPPSNRIAQNITATSFDYGLVPGGTVFYWRVTAKDNNGAYSDGPVWKFTTAN